MADGGGCLARCSDRVGLWDYLRIGRGKNAGPAESDWQVEHDLSAFDLGGGFAHASRSGIGKRPGTRLICRCDGAGDGRLRAAISLPRPDLATESGLFYHPPQLTVLVKIDSKISLLRYCVNRHTGAAEGAEQGLEAARFYRLKLS